MARILAIDTSSAWCSVALSLNDAAPLVRHQKVSAGASQLILPWIDELLAESSIELSSLDAIAIGNGPGAFTGVRLGVAVVQGLAIAAQLPVLPVASLDALASQVVLTNGFIASGALSFVVAIDARMGEVYWARYKHIHNQLPQRQGDIYLSDPEAINLEHIDFLAGSAIAEFGDRLFASIPNTLTNSQLDAEISITALGVLGCAQEMWRKGLQQDVHLLEPLYIRNKVAFTASERIQQQG